MPCPLPSKLLGGQSFFPPQDRVFPPSQGRKVSRDPLRALLPHVQVSERGGAHTGHPDQVPDARWLVEDGDTKGKWTRGTRSPRAQSALTSRLVWYQKPSSPIGPGTSAPGSVTPPTHTPGQPPPPMHQLPRCAGCQAGTSPRTFSADPSLTAQGQEGQRGPRPRPLGSTSFLFSLHPALLWLTSCRGLRKWSRRGLGAGSLGPESQHPDCNNGGFKHQENRQTQTEAQGKHDRVSEATRNRGRGREGQTERFQKEQSKDRNKERETGTEPGGENATERDRLGPQTEKDQDRERY